MHYVRRFIHINIHITDKKLYYVLIIFLVMIIPLYVGRGTIINLVQKVTRSHKLKNGTRIACL